MSRWPYRIIRWSFAAIFIYSGVAKLFDPKAFGVVIEAFGLIPEFLVIPVAIILPILEILTGVAVIWDIRWCLEAMTGLLVLFMAILGYGIYMGLDIDCGCFGPDDPEQKGFGSLRPALYRDQMMMAGIIYLYIWRYLKNKNKEELLK
jgi:uncharacterized membrane protein YphA (DoxX/SURF4 family)